MLWPRLHIPNYHPAKKFTAAVSDLEGNYLALTHCAAAIICFRIRKSSFHYLRINS